MTTPNGLLTNLTLLAQRAEERRDDFEVMQHLLLMDDDLDDGWLDAQVEALAAPIVAAIDCTQCANCCRSLDVYLTPDDAQRLADGIDVPLTAILDEIDHERAEKVGEWGRFKAKPCAFLKGNLCSVYSHRPETCRLYPQFTPDFRWTLDDALDGAGLCPILYNVLDALCQVVEDWLRET